MSTSVDKSARLSCLGALAGIAAFALAATPGSAQTYGFATMQPGTLNHTTASAIAKVLKEKGGPQRARAADRGRQRDHPDGRRAEAEIGIANAPELHNAFEGAGAGGKQTDLRIIGTAHPLRVGFWVRKDAPMHTIADLKGKRVAVGLLRHAHARRARHAPCWRPAA